MVISGNQFIKGLCELGICNELTRRVVIDATVGEVIMVYVEQYGSKDLLQVGLTASDIQVFVLGGANGEGEGREAEAETIKGGVGAEAEA